MLTTRSFFIAHDGWRRLAVMDSDSAGSFLWDTGPSHGKSVTFFFLWCLWFWGFWGSFSSSFKKIHEHIFHPWLLSSPIPKGKHWSLKPKTWGYLDSPNKNIIKTGTRPIVSMTTSSPTYIYHKHLQVNILETTTHRIESPGSLVLFGGGWMECSHVVEHFHAHFLGFIRGTQSEINDFLHTKDPYFGWKGLVFGGWP